MSSGRSFQVNDSRVSMMLIAAAVALAGVASGCGQSTYAERVDRTSELFAYHNRLDQNLQAEWSRTDWRLGLRPPVRFRLMPAPAPPAANDEGVAEVVVDTRQPSYLGVELPGLVAAWEVPGEAFLYLCTNHQRLVDTQTATPSGDPESFLVDLEGILQQAFEFTLSDSAARGPAELHAKFAERIPASDKFAPPKAFESIRIEKSSEPRFAANLFEHKAGPVQVALLLVYSPTNPRGFENAVRIALETFKVDPAIPRAAAVPGSASPGGGAARPAF